jgi:hypothetical protein
VGSGNRDVYLACRELRGQVKLSLHGSGRWHVGFDAPRFPSMFEKGFEPETRFAGRWERPAPIISGLTLACRVHTPWYAVTIPVESLDQKVSWIQAAPQGKSIEVVVFLSDRKVNISGWPGRRSMKTNLVGSIELDGGGCVWVVYHEIQVAEPKLPTSVSPKYFRDASERHLFEKGTRALIWGDFADGSVAFFEGPVRVSKNSAGGADIGP